MSLSQSLVLKLYSSVIEDVISGVRDTFLDDGVDEQVLQELKQLWEAKLNASKAVESANDIQEHQNPSTMTNNIKSNGTKSVSNITTTTTSQPTNTLNQTTLTNIASLDPTNKVPVQLTLPAQAGVPGSSSRIFTLQIPASALQNNQLHSVLTGPIITATMTLPHHLAATLLQQHINTALSGGPQQAAFTASTTNAIQAKSQVDGACDSSDDDEQVTPGWSCSVINRDINSQPGCSHSMASENVDSLIEKELAKNARRNTKKRKLKSNKLPAVIKFQVDGADDTSDDDMSDPAGAGASDDDADGASGIGSDGEPGEEDGEDGEDGGAEDEPLNSEDDVSEEDPFDMFDTDNVVVCQYDKISRSRNKWKFYLKDGIMNLSGKDFVFQKANGDAEW